jgi:hypothetical protein
MKLVYAEQKQINTSLAKVQAYMPDTSDLPGLIHLYESEPGDREGIMDAVVDYWIVAPNPSQALVIRQAIKRLDEQIARMEKELLAVTK